MRIDENFSGLIRLIDATNLKVTESLPPSCFPASQPRSVHRAASQPRTPVPSPPPLSFSFQHTATDSRLHGATNKIPPISPITTPQLPMHSPPQPPITPAVSHAPVRVLRSPSVDRHTRLQRLLKPPRTEHRGHNLFESPLPAPDTAPHTTPRPHSGASFVQIRSGSAAKLHRTINTQPPYSSPVPAPQPQSFGSPPPPKAPAASHVPSVIQSPNVDRHKRLQGLLATPPIRRRRRGGRNLFE